MKTNYLYVSMMAVAVMLSGCGSTINRNQYVLDVSLAHAAKVSQPSTAILEVRTFSIDSEFGSRQMVYRTGDFKYVPDYYNEFLISPALMITQTTRNWLADTGLFARVLEPGGAMTPTYVLDGSIAACYADVREKTAPAAVLRVRVFFLKHDKGINTLVWSHTFDIREPMKNSQAESFVVAMSKCVESVLQKLQENLQEQAI